MAQPRSLFPATHRSAHFVPAPSISSPAVAAEDHPLSLILSSLGQTQEAYLILTPDTGDDRDPDSGQIIFLNAAFHRLTG